MLSGEVPKPFFHHFPGFLEIAFCRAWQPYNSCSRNCKSIAIQLQFQLQLQLQLQLPLQLQWLARLVFGLLISVHVCPDRTFCPAARVAGFPILPG